MTAAPFRRVCVYCGSNEGARPIYRTHAYWLGRMLALRGIGIVYGGASVGLMGILADAARAAGGEVIGVIPEALIAKEIAHSDLSELHLVGTMHERKALMADLSEAFVTLPGGFGTLDELFETITWTQLGLYEKPVGLLNTAHCYDPLIAAIAHAVSEGFIKPHHAALLQVADDPPSMLACLERHRPAAVASRWIRREEI